ncbi:hypothetical protein V1511DRAFT_511720 [Dipodascopsis uninucleata]
MQEHSSHLTYACVAAVVSLGLYVFGPSLPSFLSGVPEHEKTLKGMRASKYTVGLINNANDCFANSSLQALASCSELRKYLEEDDHTDQPLTRSLRDTINELNTPILKAKAISPWPFLHVLEAIYKSRISRSQHDAHELLHLILETITNEYERKIKSSTEQNSTDVGKEKEQESARNFLSFEGTTKDIIRCQRCRNVRTSKATNFIILTLNVPEKWSTSLDSCLANLLSTEQISDYGCQSCRLKALIAKLEVSPLVQSQKEQIGVREKTESDEIPDIQCDEFGFLEYLKQLDPNADLDAKVESQLPKEVLSTITRTTLIGHLPNLLILHLSRSLFSSTATRNSCRVSFPELLTVFASRFIDTSSGIEGMCIYKLVALVKHTGTHSTGHYECYRRKEMFGHILEEYNDRVNELNSSVLIKDQVGSEQHTQPSASISEDEKQKTMKSMFKKFTGGKNWWRISDEKVWESSADEVLRQTQSVYLLLYQAMTPEEIESAKLQGKL